MWQQHSCIFTSDCVPLTTALVIAVSSLFNVSSRLCSTTSQKDSYIDLLCSHVLRLWELLVSVHTENITTVQSTVFTRTLPLGIACLCTHRKHHHSPVRRWSRPYSYSPGPRSGLELHCVSKKVPTFKLSVTLSNLNRFSKLLHCWKAYEICYTTHMTLPTSP